MHEFMNSPVFIYLIVPILICLSRIVDVTIGTIRIILVSKGAKKVAPILGFFEVLIWLIAIGQVMKNLTNVYNYIAYAMGFALGNYIGIFIEQKLALGTVVVRIITRMDATELINNMKDTDFGLTVMEAHNGEEPVNIIFTIAKRASLPLLIAQIKEFNPNAFYSVEDVRFVSNVVNQTNSFWPKFKFNSMKNVRKSK